MATRDRTKLFIQFRKSYEHSLNIEDSYNLSASSRSQFTFDQKGKPEFELYELEELGLIPESKKKKTKDGYHLVDMDNSAPGWIELKNEIVEELDEIKSGLVTLEKLYRKRLLPGFQDRTFEENEIKEHTEHIFTKLKHCQKSTFFLGQNEAGNNVVIKNAQISLAMKLQEISGLFQQRQSAYLKKLREREKKGEDLFEQTNEGLNILEDHSQFQLVQQESTTAWEEELISQREHEIAAITDSISQLADLFQSLQTMVIDQGTLLDRIDYNVENMATNMKDAVEELQKAVSNQRTSTSRYCILALLIIIGFMILLLIVRSIFRG